MGSNEPIEPTITGALILEVWMFLFTIVSKFILCNKKIIFTHLSCRRMGFGYLSKNEKALNTWLHDWLNFPPSSLLIAVTEDGRATGRQHRRIPFLSQISIFFTVSFTFSFQHFDEVFLLTITLFTCRKTLRGTIGDGLGDKLCSTALGSDHLCQVFFLHVNKFYRVVLLFVEFKTLK